ncbi:MAG: hypothetical protein KatS3mg076_2433 [Candidatus Binatia bacterium]|nr:MAG: hypothetical protein KatS3mg076_2433 [Candidatus Binatia bacterium]
MLLRDYAITPDVFDETSYPHPTTCDAELRNLKDVLLSEGLVRDLRNGEWSRLFVDNTRPWHRRGKELLKKLVQQKRVFPIEPSRPSWPSDDVAWCSEAVATHGVLPFTGGIVVTERVKTAFPGEDLVERIDRLGSARWWAGRSSSVRVRRDIEDYLEQLAPVLRRANSLMFIDPHLDPEKPRYGGFVRLLEAAGRRDPAPVIEIHRVCFEGPPRDRTFPMDGDPQYFRQRFRRPLEARIRAVGLRVEVFVWDDFHDRHLITNLIGIHMSDGFDTSKGRNLTTWSRLGRDARDHIQREFDPRSGHHALRDRFTIG